MLFYTILLLSLVVVVTFVSYWQRPPFWILWNFQQCYVIFLTGLTCLSYHSTVLQNTDIESLLCGHCSRDYAHHSHAGVHPLQTWRCWHTELPETSASARCSGTWGHKLTRQEMLVCGNSHWFSHYYLYPLWGFEYSKASIAQWHDEGHVFAFLLLTSPYFTHCSRTKMGNCTLTSQTLDEKISSNDYLTGQRSCVLFIFIQCPILQSEHKCAHLFFSNLSMHSRGWMNCRTSSHCPSIMSCLIQDKSQVIETKQNSLIIFTRHCNSNSITLGKTMCKTCEKLRQIFKHVSSILYIQMYHLIVITCTA